MFAFRLFLTAFLAVLTGYTAAVIADHGWNLLPVFFGDMASLTWPGQFNLDFFGYLLLTGLWLAWRHEFRASGLALAVVGTLGGMMFLCVYLLVIAAQTRGNIRAMLLGQSRAGVQRPPESGPQA